MFINLLKKNWLLISSYIAFVVLVFIFALIYHEIYKRDNGSFTIQSEVDSTQKKRMLQGKEGLSKKLRVLNEVYNEITNKDLVYQKTSSRAFRLSSGHSFTVAQTVNGLTSEEIAAYTITVHLKTNKNESYGFETVMFCENPPVSVPREIFPDKPSDSIFLFKTIMQQIGRELNTLKAWNYIDFLYFSVITQTTIGFGDIIPNNTRVRTFVIVQALLSSLILIVIVNMTIRGFKH